MTGAECVDHRAIAKINGAGDSHAGSAHGYACGFAAGIANVVGNGRRNGVSSGGTVCMRGAGRTRTGAVAEVDGSGNDGAVGCSGTSRGGGDSDGSDAG